MELTQEQLNVIYELISKGEANRNKILDKVVENDIILKRILDLYKNKKSQIEIAKELNTDVNSVQEKIYLIDTINKKIDSVYSEKHVKDCARNKQKDKYNETKEKQMQVRTRRQVYQKQVKEFLSKYVAAKESGNLKNMNLPENVEKFAKKISFLGERVSYRLFLAEMYSEIGKFMDAREILAYYDKSELTDLEKHQYENIEKQIIIQENRAKIRKWYAQGMNYEDISKECERIGTENRVLINHKFIKSVINEYNKELKEEIER